MQQYIKENTSSFNELKELIADYEISYMRNSAASGVGLQLEALKLDIESIDKTLKKCQVKIQEPLWNLNLCCADEDFEAVERALQQVQVYQNAYSVLQAYKHGLEEAIEKAMQQLQPQTQRVLQESIICQLQAKA